MISSPVMNRRTALKAAAALAGWSLVERERAASDDHTHLVFVRYPIQKL
jgi:hypothetical protein